MSFLASSGIFLVPRPVPSARSRCAGPVKLWVTGTGLPKIWGESGEVGGRVDPWRATGVERRTACSAAGRTDCEVVLDLEACWAWVIRVEVDMFS